MYVHNLVKMKHHISYFYNALLEYYPLHQVWCETKFIKYRVHKWQSQGIFKMYTIGTNTSMQTYWPLVDCIIN